MKVRDPNYQQRVAALFSDAPFICDLGMELLACAPGRCEAQLLLQPRHRQQNGFVHAGVQATLADHTAGCAAATLMAAEQVVLTMEFKIHLLRPGQGERLYCVAEVLRAGKRVSVVESSVYAEAADSARQLIAKASLSMAILE